MKKEKIKFRNCESEIKVISTKNDPSNYSAFLVNDKNGNLRIDFFRN